MTAAPFPDDAERIVPRRGTVSNWTTTTGGYQRTVIDGQDYLTGFDLRELKVQRGSVVDFTVEPPPRGWTSPHATILRIVDQVDLPPVPLQRSVRVGRRTYLVQRTPAVGLRSIYTAYEPATVDKVALRRHDVVSRSHRVVKSLSDTGRIGRKMYSSDPARPAAMLDEILSGTTFVGQVETRFSRGGKAWSQAELNAEAEAAIIAAFGSDWRGIESRHGTIVADD